MPRLRWPSDHDGECAHHGPERPAEESVGETGKTTGKNVMTVFYQDPMTQILLGDVRAELALLPDQYVQMCVTSPPYWGLRDYQVKGQIGPEPMPEAYVQTMVKVFHDVRRVLKDDGTLWLNLGDSYASAWACKRRNVVGAGSPDKSVERGRMAEGLKEKDLVGIPWRVAFALQADGWYLRSDIIWAKPNPMPESVTDRPTKAHEYLFLLSKSERYYYDAEAIHEESIYPEDDRASREDSRRGTGYNNISFRQSVERGGFDGKTNTMPGREAFRAIRQFRNKRSVWTIATAPFPDAHFATFPPKLIEPCILAGSRTGDLVLDPFHGAGTSALVSKQLGRRYIGIDLNESYLKMSLKRLEQEVLPLEAP